jgi:hypothetical protein
MKILDHKSAINRRQDNNQSFVLRAIHRVSYLNRTVLSPRTPRSKQATLLASVCDTLFANVESVILNFELIHVHLSVYPDDVGFSQSENLV